MAVAKGRFSGFRICLLSAPSHQVSTRQWHIAEFVPDHSGGTAPDFNGIPFVVHNEHLNDCQLCSKYMQGRQVLLKPSPGNENIPRTLRSHLSNLIFRFIQV